LNFIPFVARKFFWCFLAACKTLAGYDNKDINLPGPLNEPNTITVQIQLQRC
jgi:hypothetical protein